MNRPPHGPFRFVINSLHAPEAPPSPRRWFFPSLLRSALVWGFALCAIGTAAHAQFKEVGPPPYSQTVARQKIRTLLDTVDPRNPQKTVDAVFALVPWYRDILDQELISGWQKDTRANLMPVIEPLADAAVAAAIVNYSWRQSPETAFNLIYAPTLGHLMARYPDSGTPFLSDLLAPSASGRPPLSNAEAQAVCRILVDMPDVGAWRKAALQILPHYRAVARSLLEQDLHGNDKEQSYRAQMWLRELDGDQPGVGNQPITRRRPAGNPPVPASAPPSAPNQVSLSTPRTGADGRPTLARVDSAPSSPAPAPASPSAPPSLFAGATSGTLKCSGGPVPQNAEFVFRNLPSGNLRVELDTRVWEARLAPDGQTQKLILKNVSSGPQKRCTVRWSVGP